MSINIISAIPADPNLREALAKGALATAQAEQIETQARAEAKVTLSVALLLGNQTMQSSQVLYHPCSRSLVTLAAAHVSPFQAAQIRVETENRNLTLLAEAEAEAMRIRASGQMEAAQQVIAHSESPCQCAS